MIFEQRYPFANPSMKKIQLRTPRPASRGESKAKTSKKIIRLDTDFSEKFKRSRVLASSFKSTKNRTR